MKCIMRPYTLLLLLVLISISNNAKSQSASYGFQYYPTSNNQNTLGICFRKCQNGDFVLGGEKYGYSNSPSCAFVVRLTPLGDTIWKRNYWGGPIIQALPLFDNGFACIMGDSLARIDSAGNLLWTKYFNNLKFKSICQLSSDSGFAVLSERHTNNGYFPTIVRLNPNGDSLWTRTFPRTNSIPFGDLIFQLANGDILFAFQQYYNAVSSDLVIQRITPSNNLAGTFTISGNGVGQRQVVSVQPTSDGNFLLLFLLSNGPAMQCFFSKRDQNNNIFFQSTYQTSTYLAPKTCCEANTGYLLLFNNSTSGNGVRYVRTGNNGDSLWSTNINSTLGAGFAAASTAYYQSERNGFIIGGGDLSYEAAVVRTDSLGHCNNQFPYIHNPTQFWNQNSGNITINYNLEDFESDTCSIRPVFSTDSGYSWLPATPGPGGDGMTDLLSAPGSGTSHIFMWNSDADFAGKACASDRVKFRIIPRDRYSSEGNYDLISYYNMDNSSSISACGWAPNITPASAYLPLFDGLFTDSLNGVIVGYYKIKKTTNGGLTWTNSVASSSTEFRAIDSLNATTFITVASNGRIFKSYDAGSTWQQKVIYIPPLYDVSTASDSVVFAVGGTYSTNGYFSEVRKSIDAGETWSLCMHSLNGSILFGVDFLNKDTGIAVGSNGLILRTNNSGVSWDTITITNRELFKPFFYNKDTIFIVGGGYPIANSGARIILRSWDGGVTWDSSMVMDDSPQTIMDITVTANKELFACGGNGRIYKSVDWGNHWQTIRHVWDYYLFWSICFPTANTGYAIGIMNYASTQEYGIVYKTSSPLPLNYSEQEVSEDIIIYPNPASSDVVLESNFSITIQDISLVDIAGRTIQVAINQKSADSFNITTKGLCPGIYFILIKNGQQLESQKLIITN